MRNVGFRPKKDVLAPHLARIGNPQSTSLAFVGVFHLSEVVL
jgi:hypothetical protein